MTKLQEFWYCVAPQNDIGLTSGIRYIMLDDDYFSAEAKEHFKQKYIEPAGVELIDELPCSYEKSVRAGRALLIY